MAVTVFVADASVGPVNHEFRALVLRDAATSVCRLLLGVVDGRCARVARTLDCPGVPVRDNVLVLSSHGGLLGEQVVILSERQDRRQLLWNAAFFQ